MASSLSGALVGVIQEVQGVVDSVLQTVESLLGGLPLVVHAPAGAGTDALGLHGLLDSAPGGLSTASLPGLTTLSHGAPIGLSSIQNVAGGHSLPFADNTSVSVAFPTKH